MSQARPYWDYVRTSDLIQIQVAVGGSLSQQGWALAIPGANVAAAAAAAAGAYYGGFPENNFFSAARRHGLIVQNLDLSQWNSLVGGWIRVAVGANVDFAHVSDTADAAAQALQELGFTAAEQSAWFIAQVNDDITYEETQKYPAIANTIVPAQRNSGYDRIQQVPNDIGAGVDGVRKAVSDWFGGGDDASGGGNGWLLIAGAVLVIVLVRSRGRR